MFFLQQLKKFYLPKSMMVSTPPSSSPSSPPPSPSGTLQLQLRTKEGFSVSSALQTQTVYPSPLWRRLRSIRTKTSRHLNSLLPSATGLINKTVTPTDTDFYQPQKNIMYYIKSHRANPTNVVHISSPHYLLYISTALHFGYST